MSSRVLVEEYQEVTGSDLTKIGVSAQNALDTTIFDGVAAGNRYAGCSVTQNGAAVVNVAPGRAYLGGKVYQRETDTEFTLTSGLPLALSKVATIVVSGQEIDTDLQPRDYVIDVQTGEAEARTAPRERRRVMTMDVVYGAEAANPARPVTAPGAVAVADILLTPSGVQTITMLTANKLSSAEENRASIVALEQFRDQAGSRIDTLGSDLADLNARTKGIISPHVHRRMIRDISRLKRVVNLSDDHLSYSSDHFMDKRHSDDTHPQWLSRIEEGARFAAAQERIAILKPLNDTDPKLRKTGSFALPSYTDNVRISVVGNDAELSISQYQHQTTTKVKKTRSRSATRYGTAYTTCTNRAEFYNGTYNELSQTLKRDGETFKVEFTGRDYDPNNAHEGDHKEVRLQQVWTDRWTETYWVAQTVVEGINGSVIGQTFLNANTGWATFVNLFCPRVAETGDVHVLLTEVTASGAPDPARTISSTTVSANELKTWPSPTRVNIEPTHLDAGKRYAIVLITSGNHFVATVTGNKFAEGTLFHSTDGAWFQGDINKDMAFEIGFAKFAAARVEVDFEPLQLENGIAAIKLLIDGAVPESTSLVWEFEKDGVWRSIDPVNGENSAAPLSGLPALLRLRAVFKGSSDDMPGLDIAGSEVTTWRPRTDFTWISQEFDLGAGITTDTVQVDVRVEAYDETDHDIDAVILSGAGEAVEVADSVAVEADPYDPEAFIKRYVFNLADPTQVYRIKLSGTTNSSVKTFHVANLFQQAL